MTGPTSHDEPLGRNRDFKVLLGSQGISATIGSMRGARSTVGSA